MRPPRENAGRTQGGVLGTAAVREAEQSRGKLIREFGNRVERIHRAIVEMIDKWNRSLLSCKEAVIHEGRLIGEKVSI